MLSMINEWDITQTNLYRASKRHYEVAVLPCGNWMGADEWSRRCASRRNLRLSLKARF